MARLINLSTPNSGVTTGMELSFVAPCDCSDVTGISLDGATYTLVDTSGNSLTSCSGYFAKGAILTVVIDTANKKATLLNPRVNTYTKSLGTPDDVASANGTTVWARVKQIEEDLPLKFDGVMRLPVRYDEVASKDKPYTNSYLLSSFNRTPIVDEHFTGIGFAKTDEVAFTFVARVKDVPVESNGKTFVPFEIVDVVTHVESAEHASTADRLSTTLTVSKGGTGHTSVDTTPTLGSAKMVTSGGVYESLPKIVRITPNIILNKAIYENFDTASTVIGKMPESKTIDDIIALTIRSNRGVAHLEWVSTEDIVEVESLGTSVWCNLSGWGMREVIFLIRADASDNLRILFMDGHDTRYTSNGEVSREVFDTVHLMTVDIVFA